MSWNYRVTYRGKNAMEGYAIREVYYDEDGEITLYAKNPCEPFGDDEDELKWCLGTMIDAFDKEALNLDHLDFLLERKRRA